MLPMTAAQWLGIDGMCCNALRLHDDSPN
jgi:hypothetical protein